MDDFSTPGKPNYFGYEPTPANYIKPKKKPLSSMAPTIVTDKDGNVMMIAGASGGPRIITGTATVGFYIVLLSNAPVKLFCPHPPRAPPGTSLFFGLPRCPYHFIFALPRPI